MQDQLPVPKLVMWLNKRSPKMASRPGKLRWRMAFSGRWHFYRHVISGVRRQRIAETISPGDSIICAVTGPLAAREYRSAASAADGLRPPLQQATSRAPSIGFSSREYISAIRYQTSNMIVLTNVLISESVSRWDAAVLLRLNYTTDLYPFILLSIGGPPGDK